MTPLHDITAETPECCHTIQNRHTRPVKATPNPSWISLPLHSPPPFEFWHAYWVDFKHLLVWLVVCGQAYRARVCVRVWLTLMCFSWLMNIATVCVRSEPINAHTAISAVGGPHSPGKDMCTQNPSLLNRCFGDMCKERWVIKERREREKHGWAGLG